MFLILNYKTLKQLTTNWALNLGGE